VIESNACLVIVTGTMYGLVIHIGIRIYHLQVYFRKRYTIYSSNTTMMILYFDIQQLDIHLIIFVSPKNKMSKHDYKECLHTLH
jgi:hypothetical protein